MKKILVLAELVVILLHSLSATTDIGLITPRYANCTCPGEVLVFTCTVVVDSGSGATIWKGSAFECAGNEITLIHSDFIGGTSRECNGGAITGRSIGVNGTRYMSQLNVTIYGALNNKTVVCYLDSEMRQEIGRSVIRVADACSEVQPNVNLVDVSPGQLTFSWLQLTSDCSAVQYIITSQTGCGNCSISSDTSATCSDLQVSTIERNCTFIVRSMIRGIYGTPSNPVTVRLKVLDNPQINLIPVYSITNQTLINLKLIVEISPMDDFLIHEGIPGTVENYIINYSSGFNSTTSANNNCRDSVCSYMVEVPRTMCQSSSDDSMHNITLSISAANRLGPGLASEPVSIGCTNRFITVDIDPTASTLICRFLNNQSSVKKTCSVEYSICNHQKTFNTEGNSTSEFPGEVTLLLSFLSGSECFTYIVTASDGANTVIVTGRMESGNDDSSTTITVAVVVPIIIVIILVVLTFTIIILFRLCRTKRHVHEATDQTVEADDANCLYPCKDKLPTTNESLHLEPDKEYNIECEVVAPVEEESDTNQHVVVI